jgi:UDP-N-acetylglucosamine 4,6-dehydratase/5-epimerase
MNSILITGGTGSFGQALVRKIIAQDRYQRIVVYSRDEHKQERMRETLQSDKVRYFIGDVRDRDRLRLAMRGCFHIVHAAALKIVPTAEYNPQEYVKTNILGSQNIIDIVLENTYGTKHVVALSTDKAVNPINLYGATKLVMEKLFLASNALIGSTPSAKFDICRYGNVANSNGSVIQVFKRQKENGIPYTLTHEDMTRYWITLDQATDFVLERFVPTWEPVDGKLYIPKMPSFKVKDLMYAVHDDIMQISYDVIGIRPGEKLHEQIDIDKFSNLNDAWLGVNCLRSQLASIGVI